MRTYFQNGGLEIYLGYHRLHTQLSAHHPRSGVENPSIQNAAKVFKLEMKYGGDGDLNDENEPGSREGKDPSAKDHL